MYKNRSRGFTLIELLVVIAIIGILSSVVLASLNTARSKGQDAAIQSDLSAIATSAEIFYGDTNNTYGSTASSCATTAGTLWANSTVTKALLAAVVAGGGSAVTDTTRAVCGSTASQYAVKVKLVAYDGYWCTDSAGTSKAISGAIGASVTVCP